MRTPQERREEAALILAEIFKDDDLDQRILVGPDISEDDFDEAIEIDDFFAGDMRYMAHDVLSAITGEKVDPPSDGAGVTSLCKQIAARAHEELFPTWDRGDGIVIYCDEAGEAGQVAIDLSGDSPVLAGVYFGSSLYVEPGYRERSLGADLVIEQLLWSGSLAVWSLDTCAFSPKGERAHLSALKKLREMSADIETSPSM